ncbi:50S ribosomal protein L25/general stress protein Ctc [Methylobacillus flagellatus]|uniref:50S ribosomal protein L25/general stress protein Ctc n=1 Tax=Methylobacillus flagellatus TaxID=405 RepID=UPI002853A187|nr:50S ribosomal protein L25/general stress protein Ctc [Methylobacillus flagellatus]MDR5170749.1 50S ribosomal protein L25/general stress protein Ctc [Methylobacillus flagellatus]
MAITIKAAKREGKGTGASRRLRRAGNVPGVVYGGDKEAVSLEFNHKELFLEFRHETFHASILNLEVDGKKEQVVLRDYQLHPVRNTIQHIDFQRVSASEKVHVKVPLHFINADVAPGVKLGGGIVTHILTEADVSCLPKDLPEFIEVDLGNLEAGHSIHLSEIKLPKGVEFVQLAHDNDSAVASIAKPRGGAAAEGEADAEGEAAAE